MYAYTGYDGLGDDGSGVDLASLFGGSFTTLLLVGAGMFIVYKMFSPEIQVAQKKRRIRKGRAAYRKAKEKIERKYGKEAFETTAF